MHNKIILVLVITFFTVALGVLVFRGEPLMVPQTNSQSIVTNLSEQKDHKKMVRLIDLASAREDYEGMGAYTIFAPTDEAFAKLPKETLAKLEDENYREEVTRIEDNHVVLGTYPSSSFYNGMTLTTVNAEVIKITKKDGSWYINDKIRIVGADVKSNNGVIHSIDTCLIPQGI